MRIVVAACVAAFLLAGCLSSPPVTSSDNSGSPRTTPITIDPTPTTRPSSTPTTTPSTSSTPPTTLPPCPLPPSSTPSPTPGGAMLVAPHHEVVTNESFTLFGNESTSGLSANGTVTFTFDAVNGGADGQRGAPPYDPALSMRDANHSAVAIAPASAGPCAVAGILAISFASGERVESNWTWNATIYDGDRPQKAPPGSYVLTAVFHAARGSREILVTVDIPINVIPTNGPAMG